MARIVIPVVLVVALCGGCASRGPSALTIQADPSPALTATPTPPAIAKGPPPAAPQEPLAWRHLATTEGTLEGTAAAEAVESAADARDAWERYHLPGAPPETDFDRAFVLLVGQPDDACVDELIGLRVREGRLRVEWLPPPGGCDQPLVFRIHAVEVDRRHVPAEFQAAFPSPYQRDAKPVTITVAVADGSAPPEPEPPAAMTDDDVDAVFEGHAVRRCTKADERVGDEAVDGPLSRDPAVAKAQKERADFGVTSDEATTREVMASPDRTDDYGFPLLNSEMRQEFRASERTDDVGRWLRDHGYRSNVDFVMFLSRSDGIRPGVWVDGGRAGEVRRRLDAEFGNGTVLVQDNGYDFKAIDKAQRDLGALMGGSGPGSIVSSSGIPGPVQLGMIDPTRKALDRVAATVDPALVCVAPALSGARTTADG